MLILDAIGLLPVVVMTVLLGLCIAGYVHTLSLFTAYKEEAHHDEHVTKRVR